MDAPKGRAVARMVKPITSSQDIIDVVRDAINALTPATQGTYFPSELAISELESIFDFFGIDYEPTA